MHSLEGRAAIAPDAMARERYRFAKPVQALLAGLMLGVADAMGMAISLNQREGSNRMADDSLPSDDLTLTIHILRPSEKEPDGYIGLTAETGTPDGPRFENGADGKHDDMTMKRVLLDVHSYFQNGRKAWVNLAGNSRNRGHSR